VWSLELNPFQRNIHASKAKQSKAKQALVQSLDSKIEKQIHDNVKNLVNRRRTGVLSLPSVSKNKKTTNTLSCCFKGQLDFSRVVGSNLRENHQTSVLPSSSAQQKKATKHVSLFMVVRRSIQLRTVET